MMNNDRNFFRELIFFFSLLPENSTEELKREREEKKRYLLRKLSFRPTVEELKTRKVSWNLNALIAMVFCLIREKILTRLA